MNSLKRKRIEHPKEKIAAQTRLTEAKAEVDRREWERRNADVAFYGTGRQLESQRMELCQADQAQRERVGYVKNLLCGS